MQPPDPNMYIVVNGWHRHNAISSTTKNEFRATCQNKV